MRLNPASGGGVKKLLLRTILPLTIAPLALMALLNAVGNWYGAVQGGRSWIRWVSMGWDAVEAGAARRHALRIELARDALEEGRAPELSETQTLYRRGPDGGWARIHGHGPRALPAGALHARKGFFELAPAAPAYAVVEGDFALVTRVNDYFVGELAKFMLTEVTVFSSDESGRKALFTTWKDERGGKGRPAFPERLVREAGAAPDWPLVGRGLVELEAPYPGFTRLDGQHYQKGGTSFGTFQSILPLKDPQGRPVAWIDVAVPEAATIDDILPATIASLVALVMLSAIALTLAHRAANRLIDPITSATERIVSLARAAATESAAHFESTGVDTPASPVSPIASRDELSALRKAIHYLERELEAARRVRAFLEEQRAQSAYTSKLASLGEMAAGVAHEINNPLAAIQGKVEQLRDMAEENVFDRERTLQITERLEALVMRISKIVRGLRFISRNGDQDPVSPVLWRDVLEDTLELCRERLTRLGIELRVKEYDAGMTVLCRPTQVAQVLLNLISNAIDAVQGGPSAWIELEVLRAGPYLVFSVSDSGDGIPSHIRERIFHPFFTTKEVGKGTGLGLSISKGIIEAHGGELVLDVGSRHTRFVVSLPMKDARDQAA